MHSRNIYSRANFEAGQRVTPPRELTDDVLIKPRDLRGRRPRRVRESGRWYPMHFD